MPDLSNTTGMTRFLGWLRIGQVPVLITLIIFLTIFGLAGLVGIARHGPTRRLWSTVARDWWGLDPTGLFDRRYAQTRSIGMRIFVKIWSVFAPNERASAIFANL